jgi:hypothetical protein
MGSALDARGIESAPDTTIRVRYTCKIPKGKRGAQPERALNVHEKGGPASQSVRRGVNVEYTAEFEESDRPLTHLAALAKPRRRSGRWGAAPKQPTGRRGADPALVTVL